MSTTGTLALPHTSPVHVPVLDGLRDWHHPGLVPHHLVDEEPLVRAREAGPEVVAASVAAVLARAVADGADAVLCTCSTIGGVAARQAAGLGSPVLRVDRAMAAEAARYDRIIVVAAPRSTVEPTVALIAEESGPGTSFIGTAVLEGAWELFEAGGPGRPPRRRGGGGRRRTRDGRQCRRARPGVHGGRLGGCPPGGPSWPALVPGSPRPPRPWPRRGPGPRERGTDPKDGIRQARPGPPGHPGEGRTRRPRGPVMTHPYPDPLPPSPIPPPVPTPPPVPPPNPVPVPPDPDPSPAPQPGGPVPEPEPQPQPGPAGRRVASTQR
ncbi:hypothetical protein ACFC0N_18795 [Streptomyces zaomyceticus]|uniref:hypothetical protein n=1 Tax=Streptomyces zaomyceticus TaxID=68286 RepID=UPI0035D9B108